MTKFANGMARTLAAALALASINACNGSSPPVDSARSSPELVLTMQYEPPDFCRAIVEDRAFLLPADEEALLGLLRSLSRRRNNIIVSGGIEIPFRCVGPAILLVQRAGFERVGFISEPPS